MQATHILPISQDSELDGNTSNSRAEAQVPHKVRPVQAFGVISI